MKNYVKKHWLGIVTVIGLVAIVLCLALGCTSYTNEDGEKVMRLSDSAVEVLDKGEDLAPVVQRSLEGLSIPFPNLSGIFLTISAGIGAFFSAYKRYKPKLVAETKRADQYGDTTKALVYAIEEYKQADAEGWIYLKEKLKRELMDKLGPEALAVIEALVQESKKEVK